MSDEVTLSLSCGGVPETFRGSPFSLHCDPKGEKLVYGVSNNVIIRNLNDPKDVTVVSNHSLKVTAVAYAPSGFYIASGDAAGNIKIWDTVGEDHMVKYEYRPLSGEVKDISWSEDSKRLIAVGDGRDKFAVAFMWDTGATVGSASGHSKCVLSCDFRKKRPYSVVTASEDFTLLYFKNIPLKFEKTIKTHSNFVNCVRFSPSGDLVASCSSDGRIFIYDANSMDVKLECVENADKAHKGGVYGVSFSPCSQFLLSASGDKTAKIWNVQDGSCVKTFCFGDQVMDQQVGCIWMATHIVSLSLSGKINLLDKESEQGIVGSVWGHNKTLVAFAISEDRSCFFTSSYDGALNYWDMSTCVCLPVEGTGLKNQVSAMHILGDKVAVCGVNDTVKYLKVSTRTYDEHPGVKVPSQPQTICMKDENTVVVGCDNHLVVIVNNSIVVEQSSDYQVTFVCFAPDGSDLLLVCGKKGAVELYNFVGGALQKDKRGSFSLDGIGTYIEYSPDKSLVAVATASKIVACYKADNFEPVASWSPHANRVNQLSWSPDGTRIASCGVDGALHIMKPSDSLFSVQRRNVHRGQFVRAVTWLDDHSLMTMGHQDCLLKFWNIK